MLAGLMLISIQLFEQLDLIKGSKHTKRVCLNLINAEKLSFRDLHIYGVANYYNYPHKNIASSPSFSSVSSTVTQSQTQHTELPLPLSPRCFRHRFLDFFDFHPSGEAEFVYY